MSSACHPFAKDRSLALVLDLKDSRALPVLPAALRERSDRIAWLSTLRVLGLLFALAAAAPLAYQLAGVPGLVLAAVLLGMQYHKLTILLHECAHLTFFATRRLNLSVGVVAAALSGTTFGGFQSTHLRHHRLNGAPGDLEGRIFVDLNRVSRARLLLQVLGPLALFPALQALKGMATGQPSSARSTGKSDQAAAARGPSAWTGGARAVAAIVLAQLTMAAVTSWGGQELYFVPFYQLTAMIFGLFFSRLRGFCEHVPPQGWDKGPFTRSHSCHWLERWFLYDLGMNWHIEHHLYPTVPGYRLAEVNRQIRDLHTPETLHRSMLATVIGRLGAAQS